MAAGPEVWRQARGRVNDGNEVGDFDEARLGMPFEVADYVDFYSSLNHATNLGRMFRPGRRAAPAELAAPAGRVPRARGDGGAERHAGPAAERAAARTRSSARAARLDIELEAGFVIGTPSTMGEPVPIERALEHVFGMVLVNDWSARDIQAWEYQPLGPFLGKSFATSIAPWVVPIGELAADRVPGEPQEPEPLRLPRRGAWALRHRARGRAERRGRSRARTRGTCTGRSPSRSRT